MKKLLACGFVAALALVLVQMPARSVDPDAIQRSIDRGVAALKTMQRADGTWPHEKIGATVLAALTLLECGVKDDDPAVEKAARAIRSASIPLTHTYSISLAILFLDRLGDPNDVPLIESLMVRLLGGQNLEDGGWTYDCPSVNAAEAKRLEEKLKGARELRGKRELPKEGLKKTFKDLSPEIQKQMEGLKGGVPAGPPAMPGGGLIPGPPIAGGAGGKGGGAGPPAGGAPPGGVGDQPGLAQPPGIIRMPSDNSNTQFAALALWVGRRHGFPVEEAVIRLDRRFRGSQLDDGGWKYNGQKVPPDAPYAHIYNNSTPTMTCAGVLGLAISDGATLEWLKERKPDAKLPEVTKDKQLMLALQTLGATVGNPRGLQHPLVGGAGQPNQNRVAGRTYYFLWSLERCCVALDLETIGNKKWYDWGAEILLENQQGGGTWEGEYGTSGADTCFALLFLKRANLARDLTAHLRGKLKDPGERVLRGGIGVAGLRNKKIGSGVEYNKEAKPIEKPAEAKMPDTEEGKLAGAVLKATGSKQMELIEKMQSEKGPVNTAALALAIPFLEGEMHKRAREALAERLTRMKEETLSDYLQDENAEIRRAAALAVAMKESKTLIPNLIALVRDPETSVVRAAHAALKSLTGQDFGPSASATREERDQVAVKWLQWWGQQRKKTVKE